jgi:outer membrane protein assembly factor BamB
MGFVYRELNLFDPKARLKVDETFKIGTPTQLEDPLGDLVGAVSNPDEAPGKNFQDFRTKGHITANLIPIQGNKGGNFFLCANHKGEFMLMEYAQGKIAVAWNITIPGAFYRSAVIVDGIAFCVTKQGSVSGIQLNWSPEGKPLEPTIVWQKALNQTVFSQPLATEKVLIISSMNSMHAFDCYRGGPGESGKLGRKLWEHNIPSTVSSPELGKGSLYIGCEDKNVYSFKYSADGLANGWNIKTDGSVRSKPYLNSKGNYLLVGSMDGVLYALEPNTGKAQWTFTARAPIHSEIASFLDGNDEYFLVGNDEGTVYCLNFYGKQQWKFNTDGRIRCQFLIHGNNVYFGSEDNHMYGLNKTTGKLVLKYNTDGNINGMPVIFENRMFIASTDNFIHGIYI